MASLVGACRFSCVRLVQGRLVGNLASQSYLCNGQTSAVNVLRQMSHKRTIPMQPTNFEWRKFKDHLHFYVLLGAIPTVALIGAVNLFIGPAELADIPEDYEPKHWEYHRHPISRFIARYIHDPPEKLYERHMHFINLEFEKIQMRKLEEKVELLTEQRGDSKYWYYIPVNADVAHVGEKAVKVQQDSEGLRG